MTIGDVARRAGVRSSAIRTSALFDLFSLRPARALQLNRYRGGSFRSDFPSPPRAPPGARRRRLARR
jgi:hypothetical protein